MKYIIELILTTIILFFVWNILKRIFFTSFYQFPPKNNNQTSQNQTQSKEKHGLNWDAEDADFEEVKEEEKLKK